MSERTDLAAPVRPLFTSRGWQGAARTMGVSNDPLTVPFDRLIELVRELGINPVDPGDIRRITIDPMGVEVVRYRRTEAGGLLLGFGEQSLTETVTIGFVQ